MERSAYRRALDRIRAEYLEMPGVRLTPAQVEWTCGIDLAICTRVLEQLASAGFLCRTEEGSYARVAAGRRGSRLTMARAAPRRARRVPRRTR